MVTCIMVVVIGLRLVGVYVYAYVYAYVRLYVGLSYRRSFFLALFESMCVCDHVRVCAYVTMYVYVRARTSLRCSTTAAAASMRSTYTLWQKIKSLVPCACSKYTLVSTDS